jgi:hypothetical protein
MSFMIAIIAGSCILVGFFVLANFLRELKSDEFQLKPNCLLTRHPVVFLTGPRSLFYHRKYWNTFPALLAEHGYEVFTLSLPWKGAARKRKMQQFLQDQNQHNKRFHFVLDTATQTELADVLKDASAVLSQTNPADFFKDTKAPAASESSLTPSLLFQVSYALHRWFSPNKQLPTARELGAEFPRGANALLARMQELGEEDFLR